MSMAVKARKIGMTVAVTQGSSDVDPFSINISGLDPILPYFELAVKEA